MVSSLLAGIPLSSWSRTGMPRLLTRGDDTSPILTTEWPASSRNGGRHQIGMLAGFASEWVAGFRRNPQIGTEAEAIRRLIEAGLHAKGLTIKPSTRKASPVEE